MSPRPQGNFQGVSPVLMSSSCDVLANNSAIPDSGQLSYPFRKAVIIEEIRFDLRIPFSNEVNIGSLVSVKFNLGLLYLMRDAVPLWLLGTLMDIFEEENSPTVLGTETVYSHYRWRLPEPLYVEAGQYLNSTFSRGDDGFGSINVQVTYVGKTVAPDQPRPKIMSVPYVAPFVTTLGQVYQQSNERHLFNPFDVPIRIQRLTGRVLTFDSGVTATQDRVTLTPVPADTQVTILMNDSWGGKMVNNNTGPGDIFDLSRGAWTVDTIMPPKGVYEVRVWNIVDLASQVHIAMIGSREERV